MSTEEKESPQMTKAKVRGLYFGMFMTLMTTLVYPTLKQLYPELLETDHEHKLIHEEAEKVALNFPSLMNKKYKKDSLEWNNKLRTERKKRVDLELRVYELEKERESYKELIAGIQKQINFNTFNGYTRDVALYDLMRKDEDCEEVRYTRQKVDRYIMFDDWYDVKTLQQIISGSGCRIKVTPFDRSRIEVQ